jgi:pimeloyl-ACP methyl ester carboxylesterase
VYYDHRGNGRSGRPPVDSITMKQLADDAVALADHIGFDGAIYSVAAMARGFEVLASWSSVDRLATITCPTLLVVGRHDVFASFPQSYRIARHLPDAEVVVLEDSGHFPWIEEPDTFFIAVTDWLGRHAVPGSAGE